MRRRELFPRAYAEVHSSRRQRPVAAPAANTVLFEPLGASRHRRRQRRIQLKSIVEGRDFGNTSKYCPDWMPTMRGD